MPTKSINTNARLSAPVAITAQCWPDGTTPTVTISCLTFNHVRFIEDAIKGFLMQETSFCVEILIYDDASTDGTSDIVRHYANRYPSLIHAVVQPENTYKKLNRIEYRRDFFRRMRGKYIATCEGDDYWTDPLKLQIQVEFLDSNPDVVISGHDAIIVDAEGRQISESKLPRNHQRDYAAYDLVRGRAWILTLSAMIRRNAMMEFPPPEASQVINGDVFRDVLLGKHGGSKYHDDIQPGVYRRHPGGIWSMIDPTDRHMARVQCANAVYRYFRRTGDKVLAQFWADRCYEQAVQGASMNQLWPEVLKRTRFVAMAAKIWHAISRGCFSGRIKGK
jgi:glycosyltransferase involved in cell wall biosynthesis